MKLKALSNYDGDKSTRFGDCILIYDLTSMIVYDCGHGKHAEYLISDNTGSSPNSGGSEDIVKYMKDERYRQAYNTKDKIIDLPTDCSSAHSISKRRTSLGDLDSI